MWIAHLVVDEKFEPACSREQGGCDVEGEVLKKVDKGAEGAWASAVSSLWEWNVAMEVGGKAGMLGGQREGGGLDVELECVVESFSNCHMWSRAGLKKLPGAVEEARFRFGRRMRACVGWVGRI